MSGAVPEEQVRQPLASQRWRRVLFLHWRLPPDRLQRALPKVLTPDTYDGDAWVGLVAFQVEDFRVSYLPLPLGAGSYPETNIRTYVRAGDGTDGIWFFSLESLGIDADQPPDHVRWSPGVDARLGWPRPAA